MSEPVKRKDRRKQAAVPEFVPDTEELVQLVKHWTKAIMDIHLFCFVYQQSLYDESGWIRYGESRIDSIAKCLDDAMVKKAVKEAEDEFANHCEAWRIFGMAPTKKESISDKVRAEMDKEALEDDDEFHADLIRFIAGEPCNIRPTRSGGVG